MKLFGKNIGRSRSNYSQPEEDWTQGAIMSAPDRTMADDDAPSKTVRLRLEEANRVGDKSHVKKPTLIPGPAVNIWDLDDPSDDLSDSLPQLEPEPEQTTPQSSARVVGASVRKRRTKTRLLGFEKSDGRVVDMMNNPVENTGAKSTKFPVGWVVVVKGPGRGESFTLLSGMSSIGRGDDQSIQLDFGDRAISRSIHAAIVYDPETTKFQLGHGGKSNIVRLNDNPVISNETLKDGDLIRIGETTIRFASLCGETFNWEETTEGDLDSVEIAGTPI
ncbi:MAG: FHA domain-containing protein [Sulfitobacter sp.]